MYDDCAMCLGWCTCQYNWQRTDTFSWRRVTVNTQRCRATDSGWVQQEQAVSVQVRWHSGDTRTSAASALCLSWSVCQLGQWCWSLWTGL